MKHVSTASLPVFALVLGFILNSGVQAADVPDAASLKPLGLEVSWTGQAVINRSRDVIRHVVNDEELVYVQSTAGVVTVFNAETGRRMWAKQLGRNDEFSFAPVSNNNLVFVISGPMVRGMDKFTGETVFEYRLKGPPAAAPAVNENFFYVAHSDGSVYAFSISVMEYLDRYNSLPSTVAQPYEWRFISNERIRMAPIVADGMVCFVTEQRNLHSLAPNGETAFQIFLNDRPSAPLAVDSSGSSAHVIVATDANQLFSFELARGGLAWNFPVERGVSEQPLVYNGRLYVVIEQTGVTCISAEAGRHVMVDDKNGAPHRWFVRDIESLTGITDDHLFGIDRNRRLVAIRLNDGGITATAGISDYMVSHMNNVTDRLYLVSKFGELVCLKPEGSEFAAYHQRPQKQPLRVDVSPEDSADDGDAE